jgi:hypothetical protein
MNSRFTPQQVTAAKLASNGAKLGLRHMQRPRVNYARPARGHIPFDGHRTCGEVRVDGMLSDGLKLLSERMAND